MSIDIVEIALSGMKDWSTFEKLASEIMRLEGYHDIKPLGGVGDLGQDAEHDGYYEKEGRVRTVFQYTLQKDYIAEKLNDTIEKLIRNGIEFAQLVLVTPSLLTTQRQIELKKHARENHDVSVEFFDRKTLVNRLSDFTNGIFHRCFPDIEKQLAILRASQPALLKEGDAFEVASLKVSISFVFSKGADAARKAIFDRLILATLSSLTIGEKKIAMLGEITTTLKVHLKGASISRAQIEAALGRLQTQKLLINKNGMYSLSSSATKELEKSNIEINELTSAAISDIVESVCNLHAVPVSTEERTKLERNAKDVLADVFRLMGLEIAHQFLGEGKPAALYFESKLGLLEIAKRQVPGKLGELLIAAIGESMRNPSSEQAVFYADWARSFIGAAIMNMDPTMREFQATRFRQKVFILDTDFVLDCIVSENPRSKACLAIIESLSELGARIIVPKAVVSECATHAKLSPRTHAYFEGRLFSLTDSFIEERVFNVFVKGYYYGRSEMSIPRDWSYYDYLRNYFDPADPITFMQELISVSLPDRVEIMDPSGLLDDELDEEFIGKIRDELIELMKSSRKFEYRSEEENKELAETDARLFATAMQCSAEGADSNQILAGKCYIVTNSARYLRVSKDMNIRDIVSTRPQKLLAIIETITGATVDEMSFVQLFENPLLNYAVEQIWPDIEVLLKNGISLTGKSLVRLRWDLDSVLHDRISALSSAEKEAERLGEDASDEMGDREYLSLISAATKSGYQVDPRVSNLEEEMHKLKKEAEYERSAKEKLQSIFDLLAESIDHFSKKQQRKLRKILKRAEAEDIES